MLLLTINTGSSSVRLGVYQCFDPPTAILRASACYRDADIPTDALLKMFLQPHNEKDIVAVAHRVVHGGDRLTRPCIVDSETEAEIERIGSLAPLHNPIALEWIRASRRRLDGIPQIAVFDTGLFADLPRAAQTYAIPRQLSRKYSLRRYGFHGLAHEAMWRRWRTLCPEAIDGGRVISFQLGSGCSVAAIDGGVPRDTSMGFSPLEGLMMATRCGDVDPGLLIFLQEQEGLSAREVETLLSRESGLRGVAGDADMRRLLARDDADARLALEMYCTRARKYLGAYLALLGGADAVLIGGGVGQHAPAIRSRILGGLEWAGIKIDMERNEATTGPEACISHQTSNVDVWVMAADEGEILAEAASRLLTERS